MKAEDWWLARVHRLDAAMTRGTPRERGLILTWAMVKLVLVLACWFVGLRSLSEGTWWQFLAVVGVGMFATLQATDVLRRSLAYERGWREGRAALEAGDPPLPPRPARPAKRPEGVYVHLPDGSKVPCELSYDGTDDEGQHVWVAATAVPVGARVTVDKLPGHTTITFPT